MGHVRDRSAYSISDAKLRIDTAPQSVGLPTGDDAAVDTPKQDARQSSIFWVGCLSLLVAIFGVFIAIRSDSNAQSHAVLEASIGATLASGGLYHVDASTLDHRALVRARIEHLSETPDVVVIADRAWQLVQQDMRWDRRMFGAYLDGLEPDDISRIVRKLLAAGHVPELIVIGLSPRFLAQSSYGAGFWANVVDARDRRSAAIGDAPGRVSEVTGASAPRPGLRPYDSELDTFFPDGSIVWPISRSSDSSIGAEQAEAKVFSLSKALQHASFSQIIETGETIADAKAAGIEVVLTLTPLHPEIYGRIHNSRTSERMHEAVEDLLAMARGLDVATLGSFEPYAAGCKATSFASIDVPDQTCLSRFLDAAFVMTKRKLLQDRVDESLRPRMPTL